MVFGCVEIWMGKSTDGLSRLLVLKNLTFSCVIFKIRRWAELADEAGRCLYSNWLVIRIWDNCCWKWVVIFLEEAADGSPLKPGVVSSFPILCSSAVGWSCDTGSRVPKCGQVVGSLRFSLLQQLNGRSEIVSVNSGPHAHKRVSIWSLDMAQMMAIALSGWNQPATISIGD